MLLKIHEDEHVIFKKIGWYPCTLGRSMYCDVRLSHPSVSARHAAIEVHQDSFILRDLGSTNGIFHNGQRVSEVMIQGNGVFWLGDTQVEWILEESLPKTGPGHAFGLHSDHTGIQEILGSIGILFVSYLGALLLALFDAYGRVWPPDPMFPLFVRAFIVWGLGSILVAILALFSKVNVKIFHFREISVLVFGFGFLGMMSLRLMDTFLFNVRSIPGSQYFDVFLLIFLAFFSVNSVMHLVLANMSRRVRLLICSALALSFVFLMRWREPNRGDESGRTLMSKFGVPFVDPAAAIDSDSEDLRGFFFRTIAEVDGDRGRALEHLDNTELEDNHVTTEKTPKESNDE